MGFIRGALIFLLSLIIFLCLFFANLFLNLTWSLEYGTLEPNLVNFANDFVNQSQIAQNAEIILTEMEYYCMTHTNYIFEVEKAVNVEIPCGTIDLGLNKIVENAVKSFIYKVYYGEYDCDLWTCVKSSDIPFVLISEKSKDYWRSKFNLVILIAAISFVLTFFVVRKKSNAFINTGIMTILAAVLFRESKLLLNIFPDDSIFKFLEIFFARENSVFVIMVLIGILILVVGVLFRFFGIGAKLEKKIMGKNKKEGLTKEDIKAAVREELGDSKKLNKEKKKLKKAEKGYKDFTKKK